MAASSTKSIAFTGQLAALVVIFQASTLYLPFIGGFISHFATLLVAIAASLRTRDGFLITLSASFLLLFFAPQQIPSLLLFDGSLGIWIGWGLRNQQGRLFAWLFASITTVLGISLLTWLLGIPLPNNLLFITGFSLIYTWIWFAFTRQTFAIFDRRFN